MRDRRQNKPKARLGVRRTAILIAAAALAPGAFADGTWIGPTGIWSDYTNWDVGWVPSTGEYGYLIQSATPNVTVTFDDSAFVSDLAGFFVDHTGGSNGGSIGFSQVSNSFTTTFEHVGVDGVGTVSIHGGTHTISGAGNDTLYVGMNPGSSGRIDMSGGRLVVTDSAYVGFGGSGTVNHSGGQNTISSFLVLGGDPSGASVSGSGVYNLSGGRVDANVLYVGLSGTGVFNQSGGEAFPGSIAVGYLPGSSGTVMLTGGNMFSGSFQTIGDQGSGKFTQTGGQNTNAGMTLGNAPGASGTLTLSSGVLQNEGAEVIGSAGTGTLIQNGGAHTARSIYAALQPGSTGSITLSGNATLTVNTLEYIGYHGPATLTQTGGTHSAGYLGLGQSGDGSGTVTLSGGTLSASQQSVGYQSVANTFNQSGGVNTASDFITVGDQPGAAGVYNLTGGTLVAKSIFNSWQGLGVINQTGGTIIASKLFLGHEAGGSASFNLSGGTLSVLSSEDIGFKGTGLFNQTGGTHTVAGTATISIASQSGGVGTFNLRGGTLTAGPVVNNGAFNVFTGTPTVGAVSGIGTTTLSGTNASPTILTAASVSQGTLAIGNNTAVHVLVGAPHSGTSVIGALTIGNTSGMLDIGSNDLVLDNTRTPIAAVKGYWRAGYNIQTSGDFQGAGFYDGTHGLISSVAKADPSFKHQVGYIDGNVQNIYGFTMSDIGGPDLATNRILVRPVLMGDVNFDGKVDPSDIQVLLGTNKFNKGPGSATDGWIDGDFNGDGVADPTDIQLLLAANTFNSGQTYGGAKSAKASTKTLTGGRLVVSATTTLGGPGDNKLDYTYDPITGDVSIYYDNDTNITAANTLQHLKLASAAGRFIVANVNNIGVATSFSTESATLLDMVQNDNTKPIPDRYDLGNILPQGLTEPQLTSDLTLQFGVLNQFSLKSAELLVPEPTTLGLMGIGALGLLGRRRRAKNA